MFLNWQQPYLHSFLSKELVLLLGYFVKQSCPANGSAKHSALGLLQRFWGGGGGQEPTLADNLAGQDRVVNETKDLELVSWFSYMTK